MIWEIFCPSRLQKMPKFTAGNVCFKEKTKGKIEPLLNTLLRPKGQRTQSDSGEIKGVSHHRSS